MSSRVVSQRGAHALSVHTAKLWSEDLEVSFGFACFGFDFRWSFLLISSDRRPPGIRAGTQTSQ
jgi:hypothetical protein